MPSRSILHRLNPRRKASTRAARARLYLKADCGLCEVALALLKPYERRGRLILERVDITTDAELFRRYALTIPVLEIEDGPAMTWPFDQASLRAWFL